jgi:hypothetical protein
VFHQFLIAYGGQNIVTRDGKLHVDDPLVKEAAIKALTYPATAYKEGFVPPSAINWNDADDKQRLSRQDNRYGSRRHDLDRSRDICEKGGLQRHRDDGAGAQQ